MPCGSRQVPPRQLGWKIGQGLGRDAATAVPYSGYWITLGSVFQVGERYGSHILRNGGTMWRLRIWTGQGQYYTTWSPCGRLSQPGVRCYTAEMAEGLCQGKTLAHREGSRTVEEYTYGITRRGIITHGHLAQHKG